MKAKFLQKDFGACPHTFCDKQTVLPVGLSDFQSDTLSNPMKMFCPCCRQIYDADMPSSSYIDGAFFGTTFPHLFLKTYPELVPERPTHVYVPRVFGFKVHTPPGEKSPKLLKERPARKPTNPHSDFGSDD